MWFRRDLRIDDNTALSEACAQAKQVIPVYVFDTAVLSKLEDRDDAKVTYMHRSLSELSRRLRGEGSALLVRVGEPVAEIPRLADRLGAATVFVNADYDPDSKRRDAEIAEALAADGRSLERYKDIVVYEPTEIVSRSGEPYTLFTPYLRAWLARLALDAENGEDPAGEKRANTERLARAMDFEPYGAGWGFEELGFRQNPLVTEAGEGDAHRRFARFLERIDRYVEERDFPAAEATSGLSTALRFGTISIRTLVRAVREREGEGSRKWLSELVWREFFHMILDRFPRVVEGAFHREFSALRWPGNIEHFEAWRDGRTGYPLIDASMRCLRETGWLHNRLRMAAASFLVKDLLLDWRLGEAWFAHCLLDHDIAANNGGWQWCASTGADAQPYFRVFNPVLQSRKYDPEGRFIRRFCPELSAFPRELIHWPHAADADAQRRAGCRLGTDYPHPIVDHRESKERAIRLYRAARAGAA
ncbi:MAG: deoxyribodipyrimidine photo-lyase [Bacteroidota bacterium]|nr:deoxyribodipyrimidine photo-lyase [Bacteroidota bacterium]